MNKAISFTIYFLIAAAFILKAPSVMDNMSMEGKEIMPNKIYQYNFKNNFHPTIFPVIGKRQVAIFWASWCIPCKVELDIINKAIAQGELDKNNLFAISLDQSINELDAFLMKKNYQFKTYMDKDLNFIGKLKISATPTLIYIDEFGKIKRQTTGVSFSLVSKINSFVQKN